MIRKVKKTAAQRRFWKQVEDNKKEFDSWPQWKKDQAKQWLKDLDEGAEIQREYLEALRQYSDQGWF